MIEHFENVFYAKRYITSATDSDFTYLGLAAKFSNGIIMLDLLHKSANVGECLLRKGVICALWRIFARGLFHLVYEFTG
jgi:hypothetical protein